MNRSLWPLHKGIEFVQESSPELWYIIALWGKRIYSDEYKELILLTVDEANRVFAEADLLDDEVLLAVLVDKRHNRKVEPDYRGFWRNAPGIYAVKGL